MIFPIKTTKKLYFRNLGNLFQKPKKKVEYWLYLTLDNLLVWNFTL